MFRKERLFGNSDAMVFDGDVFIQFARTVGLILLEASIIVNDHHQPLTMDLALCNELIPLKMFQTPVIQSIHKPQKDTSRHKETGEYTNSQKSSFRTH